MALHYGGVIMTTIASQITSLTVVYSTVYSDADQRKHQSSASLAFVWGIHRDRWSPRTKGRLRGKCFHLMTSSCLEKRVDTYGITKLQKLLLSHRRYMAMWKLHLRSPNQRWIKKTTHAFDTRPCGWHSQCHAYGWSGDRYWGIELQNVAIDVQLLHSINDFKNLLDVKHSIY